MQSEETLNATLAMLGAQKTRALPEGFMDGVWMRAGQLEEIAARRTRLALLLGMAFIGLGVGFGAPQTAAHAEPAVYQLVDGADLSPAALLHVEP